MANPAEQTLLSRGDIVLVPFPFTDLSSQKVRPAVIVSRDPQETDLIVSFISSVLPAHPSPADFAMSTDHPEFSGTGLKFSSVIKANKLVTLHRVLILRRLGRLGPHGLADLDEKLKTTLGLE